MNIGIFPQLIAKGVAIAKLQPPTKHGSNTSERGWNNLAEVSELLAAFLQHTLTLTAGFAYRRDIHKISTRPQIIREIPDSPAAFTPPEGEGSIGGGQGPLTPPILFFLERETGATNEPIPYLTQWDPSTDRFQPMPSNARRNAGNDIFALDARFVDAGQI